MPHPGALGEGSGTDLLPAPHIPEPHPDAGKIRLLAVMARLGLGPEVDELLMLARTLPRARFHLEVLPCFTTPTTPPDTHDRLRALGVTVDTTDYNLDFAGTVDHLRRRLPGADIVLSFQNVRDIYPALEGMKLQPPLIEYGACAAHAVAGPKHLTTRYVGSCDSIATAAATLMPDRAHHAVTIPPMVEAGTRDPVRCREIRSALGVGWQALLIGWSGPLDSPARVAAFFRIVAAVAVQAPQARFVLLEDEDDALSPVQRVELRRELDGLALGDKLILPGPSGDLPALLSAMDLFCWLPEGDGPPRLLSQAGAAGLAVIAADTAAARRLIEDGESGVIVAQDHPTPVAAAILRLAGDPAARNRLGGALRQRIAASSSPATVLPRWLALFDEVLAERPAAPPPSLFQSFVLGGWESSTHRRRDGRRLDVIASTGHDAHAAQDYAQLAGLGITAGRDAVRWHLVEAEPLRYDFASFTPMLEAARDSGTQIIWDLLHYGWPDDIDIWRPEFVTRFASFARATARHVREITDAAPLWCPINEISFFGWGGGSVGYLNPFGTGRGFELKCQLARAAIAAMDELRAVDPRARFVHAEPLIAVHHADWTGLARADATSLHDAQFQAFDLLSGALWPQIGGDPRYLDIVGLNYYPRNQWIHEDVPVDVDHPLYRPLSELLFDAHSRYGRPLVVAETGTEGARRGPWFSYVWSEVDRARARGVPVEGICLYPVADHAGWDNDRLCPNGLLGHLPGPQGRAVHRPLAEALAGALGEALNPSAAAQPLQSEPRAARTRRTVGS